MAEENTPKLIEFLYEAALQGDVALFQDLLYRDPLLLHRPLPSSSNNSPLHAACNLGHTDFILEVLYRNPNLMEELDPNDKSSLLHLAVRNGHLVLVTSLVSINPRLCFVRDIHGSTPVHVAVIKGQLHVLEELLKATPAAARERVGLLLDNRGGDTIMHLCVKYNQLEVLKMAVRMVGDAEMLNATNVDGNTILHVAVANKRLEMVEFLLKDKRLKKNAPNSNGLTAMDIFKESLIDSNKTIDDHLRLTLQREKVLSSEDIKKEREQDKHLDWLEKQRSTLMVVASLIANMAFAGGLNPPGGVWQDTILQKSAAYIPTDAQRSHEAGSSIMAQQNPRFYTAFFISNTVGFVLSMMSILLLIGGLPCRRFFMSLIMVTMWVAISAMTYSYGISTFTLTPDRKLANVGVVPSNVWLLVLGLLLLGHIIRLIVRFIKHLF